MKKIPLYYTHTSNAAANKSHSLLLRALSAYTGYSEDHFDIRRERGKKPYCSNHHHLYFSVSHSENLWVCLLGETEVGCDIQFCKTGIRYKNLAERWFHPTEASSVHTERDFYDIWSRKEALVKAIGCGIDHNFKAFDSTTDPITCGNLSFHMNNLSLPHDLSSRFAAAAAYTSEFSVEYIALEIDKAL